MKKAKNIFNPFPGLRPFSFGDRKNFFGRKEQVKDVVNKISNERFIAITSPSGTGKSSLVNAGIIPCISEGSNNDDESLWKIISIRPGTSPLKCLSAEITRIISNSGLKDNEAGQTDRDSGLLRSSPEGLAEAVKQITADGFEKILLIIDQFEDIFLFKQSQAAHPNIDEYESFIRLILELHKQEGLPVHIMLVINSDFTEELRQFQDLNNLVTNSNYILPEMTREEMQKAICRPAALSGGKIDPDLVRQLLNDINDKPDKLPLLQHTLNRLWYNWAGQKDDGPTVSLKDYEAIGGVDNALVQHLNKIYEELSVPDLLVCEKIFKAITGRGTDNRDLSIPLRISDIANITGASVKKIIRIVEKFRQPDHPFLYPAHDVPLNSATVIELTHESIMRLWPRLQYWIREEAESVALYKRLAEASGRYLLGQEPLLGVSELQQALLWQKKHKPAVEWARRYNPAFDRTIEYITLSREEYEQEEMAELGQPGRAKRYIPVAAAIAVLIIAVSGFFIFDFPALLTGTRDQPELSHLRYVPGFEPLDIEDNHNDGLIDPDPVLPDLPDLPGEPFTEQRPAARVPSEEQVVSNERRPNERRPNETPAPENTVATYPPVAPEEETGPPVVQPDPEEVRAREEAMRRRMASASQTLASIALQIENDDDLKALLTLQSHIFNEKYNRASYNPDIYSGLFASVRNLYGPDHNAFKGHTASVNSLVFRPNSSIFYSASSDGTVRQWDLDDESKTPVTLMHDQVLHNKLAISPNARWLAVATDGMGIKVLDTGVGRPDPVVVNWGNNRIMTLDFYPDNQHILFAGSENEIVKYNITSALSQTIARSDSEVLSLAVSPDSETVVAGTRSGEVILFRGDDDPSGQVIHSDQGNEVHTVSFNRNGTRVAAGSLRGEVRILDVSSGNLVTTLRGHSARVVDVNFCPLNRFIASASFDGTIQLWNAQNLNARPVVLSEHGSWARAIAFSTRGDKMVTGSRQETRLLAWSTDANEMASMICARVSRNLTAEEWDHYVGEDIIYMESCP